MLSTRNQEPKQMFRRKWRCISENIITDLHSIVFNSYLYYTVDVALVDFLIGYL